VGSTDWKEVVAADEAARHAEAARAIVAMQKRKNERFGAGRALHRKGLVAAEAKLIVRPGLPVEAAHGLFAQPGEYLTWVRLSNGGVDVQSDRRPDIRGFAFRVFGIKGESALGGMTDHQDFSLINQVAFAFPTSERFFGLVLAAGTGPGALFRWLFKTFGFKGALAQIKKMGATFNKPFSGFATERFASVLPVTCGPHAVKWRLLPPAGLQPRAEARADWCADLAAHAAKGPLRYTLQMQFFVDERKTPIEDATVEWLEADSPFITVADLIVQAPSTDEAFITQVERGSFDPWQALAAHRPLGEVMRARKVVYYASQQARGAA
jgi:hypothetical protein